MGVQGSESFVLWDCDETVSYESQSGESDHKDKTVKLQIGSFNLKKKTSLICIQIVVIIFFERICP